MKAKSLQIAVVCVLAVGILTSCSNKQDAAPNVAKAQTEVAVEVAAVTEGELGSSSTLLGEVAANKDITIPSEVPGKLVSLHVKKGDTVQVGQVIAELEQTDYQIGVRQAEAAVGQAQASLKQAQEGNGSGGISPYELAQRNLEIAQDNYVKVKALVDSKNAPQSQLDQAEAAIIQAQGQLNQAKQGAASIDVAQAAITSAQVGVEKARSALDDTVVRATANGIITDVNYEVGATVTPQVPVVSLINIDPVIIKLNVSESNLSKFKQGLELDVNVPSQSLAVKGRVTYLGPSADPQTKMFPIELEIANPDRKLLPGMKVDVAVKDLEVKTGLLVPTAAIVDQDGKKYVFVVEGEKAVKREVVISEGNTTNVMIQQGVNAGEKVVTKGQSQLNDQDKVRVAQ